MNFETPALWALLAAATGIFGWRFYGLLRPLRDAGPHQQSTVAATHNRKL